MRDRMPLGALASVLMIVAGCAAVTPDAALRNEIYWDSAVECESRYRTLHVDQIDSQGNATLHSDAEARHELGPFNDCYRKAVRARVERKRQAGQAVPEAFDRVPSADID